MNAICSNVRLLQKTQEHELQRQEQELQLQEQEQDRKKVTSRTSTWWAQKVTIRDLLWDLKSYYSNYSSFVRIGGKVQEEIKIECIQLCQNWRQSPERNYYGNYSSLVRSGGNQRQSPDRIYYSSYSTLVQMGGKVQKEFTIVISTMVQTGGKVQKELVIIVLWFKLEAKSRKNLLQ